jgi:hypothetical protein
MITISTGLIGFQSSAKTDVAVVAIMAVETVIARATRRVNVFVMLTPPRVWTLFFVRHFVRISS